MPMDNMSTFLYFVEERENIRLRKEGGEAAPWTTDPILQEYRFCNIRRKDDRVSRWLLNNWYNQFSPTSVDMWFIAAIARMINWPPTLQALLESGVVSSLVEGFDPDRFSSTLELIHAAHGGGKTYTSAYMLYAGGRGPFKGVRKSDFIAYYLLGGLRENAHHIRNAVFTNSIRKVVNEIRQSFGLNTFMAGQIAADLTYLPGQLDTATDLYTYAPQGPGSLAGLNRLHNRKLTALWDTEEWCQELIRLNRLIQSKLKITDLTLHDVQNILCETSKMFRVRDGRGKPRSKYKPETAF